METKIVYDSITSPDGINETVNFRNCQSYFITVSNLEEFEYLELGLVIVSLIPTISGIQERIVYSSDLDILDSDRIYHLPREVTESNNELKAYFYSSQSLPIRFYVIISEVTLETLSEAVNQLQESTEANSEDVKAVIIDTLSILLGSPANLLPLNFSASGFETLNTTTQEDSYDYPVLT